MLLRLVLLAGLAILTGCTSVPVAPTVPQARLTELRDRLFSRVEEERLRLDANAKPLVMDAELTAAAQAHSDSMAKKHAFDTAGADGNVAVQHLLANPQFHGYVVENSALLYFTPGTDIDPTALAQTFVDIWLNSPQHKANIAFPGFDKTGIGIAVGGNQIYAAEVFTSDLGPPAPP